MTMTRPVLMEQGSAVDLVLRGYHRDEILIETGVDVGYNANSVKLQLRGIDRWQYKLAHVEQRLPAAVVEESLGAYGRGELDAAGVLAALSLANPTLVKLKKLFAELENGRWKAQFSEADRAHRRGSMAQGMVAKHGVDNPFKLVEKQAQAAATRKERYGAEYTLAAGSSLAEGARAQARRVAGGLDVVLWEEGSAQDLSGRGYRYSEIESLTGTMIKRKELRRAVGAPLADYMALHIRQRVGVDRVSELLAAGVSRDEIFDELGLMVGQTAKTAVSLSALCDTLGLGEEYVQYRSFVNRESMKATTASIAESHGVENVSQLDEVKEKKKATTLANWGADHYLRTELGRAQYRETVRARYGVDNVSQDPEVKARKALTSLSNHGAASFLKTESCQESLLAKLADKYGDDTVLMAIGAVGGDRKTVRPFMIAEVLDTAAQRTAEIYGVRSVFELEDVQARIKQTMVERYGVSNPSQVPQFQRARLETFRAVFGVDNPYQNEEVKARIREISMRRYGVAPASRSDMVKARARATNLDRYGVEHTMQSDVIQAKAIAAKRKNGTFGSSVGEDHLWSLLIAVFGVDDVVRQHRDDERYPFACDFYVPSRDLFIELNGSWTHGGHWYDVTAPQDELIVAQWQAKGTEYYTNARAVWTQRDVAKRAMAAQHELNYVTLWDGSDKLLDAKLWIAMGCPDGRDWEREYSWLPDRTLDLGGAWPELSSKSRSARAIARQANWREFYARELAMWQANETFLRKWGTTQARLYANRLEHMGTERGTGKLPDQLSDLEILRGLGISGALRAFTVFDNTAMTAVLDQYEPASVYDPCAGWGERLVTCAAREIAYAGVDINPVVVAGHHQIIEQYSLRAQSSVCGDAAQWDMRAGSHEMVFTCPPYGAIERYTDMGAENLDEAGFLAWWAAVVAMSTAPTTRVFAYQINSAWRQRMNQVLIDAGWVLAGEVGLRKQSSHFTRGKGGIDHKIERESVQVFERRFV